MTSCSAQFWFPTRIRGSLLFLPFIFLLKGFVNSSAKRLFGFFDIDTLRVLSLALMYSRTRSRKRQASMCAKEVSSFSTCVVSVVFVASDVLNWFFRFEEFFLVLFFFCIFYVFLKFV